MAATETAATTTTAKTTKKSNVDFDYHHHYQFDHLNKSQHHRASSISFFDRRFRNRSFTGNRKARLSPTFSSSSFLFIFTITITIIILLLLCSLPKSLADYEGSSATTPYRHGLARYYNQNQNQNHQQQQQQQQQQQYGGFINPVPAPAPTPSQPYQAALPPPPSLPVAPGPVPYGPYQQNYYITPVVTNYEPPPPKPQYLPGPQYCPETGRTVCSKVQPYYPLDDVLMVVKMARAKRFNISSEFVDESENDSEPLFDDDDDDDYYSDDYYGQPPPAPAYVAPVPQPPPPPPPAPPMPYPEPPYHTYHHQSRYHHGPGGGRHPHAVMIQAQKHPLVQHFHNLDWKFYRLRSNGGSSSSSTFGSKSYNNNHHNHHHYSGGGAIKSRISRMKRQIDSDGGGGGNSLLQEPLCPVRTILMEPKAALNDRRQWKYVVNLSERDPRLKQAIKVEICTTPNSPCSSQISLPFGFVSRCRQKYIKKKLISLDESGQSLSSENFFAPSCCVCEVIRGGGGGRLASATNRVETKMRRKSLKPTEPRRVTMPVTKASGTTTVDTTVAMGTTAMPTDGDRTATTPTTTSSIVSAMGPSAAVAGADPDLDQMDLEDGGDDILMADEPVLAAPSPVTLPPAPAQQRKRLLLSKHHHHQHYHNRYHHPPGPEMNHHHNREGTKSSA